MADQALENADFDNTDLDDLDNQDMQDLDLDDFGDMDIDIQGDHIMIEEKELSKFLRIAKNVASSTGRDVVSKSVCMQVDGDDLVLRATDFNVYLTYKIPLLNEQDRLMDSIVVPLEVLQKLIKAALSKIIIYKENDDYKMVLLGGDMALESYNVKPYKFELNEQTTKETSVNAQDLYDVIYDFSDVVSSAVAPQERRIVCESDGSYANYTWSIIKSEKQFGDMDIKIKDIKTLTSLLDGLEGEVDIYKTTQAKLEMRVIKTDRFEYAFLVADVQIMDELKDEMNKVLTDEGVYIDYTQLYKMIELAAELPYAVGKVEMNYNEDAQLELLIKMKSKEDALFTLNGTVAGDKADIDKLSQNISIQAKLLKIILKSFSDVTALKVSLSESGIGLHSDDYDAVVYHPEIFN